MSKLLLVSGDLMVAAVADGAARKCGLLTVSVSDPLAVAAACDADCRVVLIDLRNPKLNVGTLVAELKQLPSPPAIIAFGPHVHEQSLAEARAAGCDLVVTRGQLDREAVAILAQYAPAK